MFKINKNELTSFYNVFYLYFFIVLISYSSVLLSKYAFSDDWSSINNSLYGSDSFQWDVLSGRPVYALFRLFWVKHVIGLGELYIIRTLSVIGTFILSICLYCFIKSKGVFNKDWMLFSCPIVIILLPSFQVYNSWATCSVFVYSVLLSLISYWFSSKTEKSKKTSSFVFSIILLFISFSIYQPSAISFIFFMMVDYCFGKKNRPDLKNFLLSTSVMISGLLFSLFLSKKLPSMIYGEYFSRSEITNDFIGKIKWFINEPLVNAINNFNISPSSWFTVFSLVLSVVGVIKFLNRDRLKMNLMFIFLMPVACYAPNLIVKESWAAFRSLIGLELCISFFFIIGFFFLLDNFKSNIVKIIASISLPIIMCIFNIQSYIITPQQAELNSLASYIDRYIPKNYKGEVNFDIRNPAYNAFSRVQRYDEFGNISLATPWAVIGMTNYIKTQKGYSFSTIGGEDKIGVTTTGNDIIIKTGDAMRSSTYNY